MVEVFKTNVRRRGQAILLLNILSRQFPLLRINFDLDDCDKILRVEGEDISQEKIAELVTENGYNCEILV
ncbi:MAG: hypothetical protein JWP37_3443 [Mucilaginibacter sp.]|nr:hypothetical protein [Mucilaginibacter sp.]